MSCYGCTREFSLFNREAACNKCGFGFCSNCLKYKSALPNKGPKEVRVCGPCHQLVKNPPMKPVSYAPPDVLLKRLEALENPGGSPVIVYRENQKMANLKRGLSVDDQKLVDRLQALQRERKGINAAPTDTQIKERLNKLRGEESQKENNCPVHQPPDKRSDVEKSHDLLEGIQKEVDLDTRLTADLTPEQDIAMRLAKLRGENPEAALAKYAKPSLPDPQEYLASQTANQGILDDDMEVDEVGKLMEEIAKSTEAEAKAALSDLEKDKAIQEQLARLKVRPADDDKEGEEEAEDSVDSDSEDKAAEKLAAQILREQELDDNEKESRVVNIPSDGGDDDILEQLKNLPTPQQDILRSISKEEDEPEELPWCIICNEDPTLRCEGCDGDLYCKRCYNEGHDPEDIQDHRTRPYRAKK